MEEWEKSAVAKEEAAWTNSLFSSKLHLRKKGALGILSGKSHYITTQ